MRYELLDHAADTMVRCTGRDLSECFENAAYAMFDQVIDADKVEIREERTIEVEGSDGEERLYAFLSELLFILDTESMVFRDFSVTIDEDKVICTAGGERLDPARHHAKAEIKAVTYHMLSVDESVPCVTVIFDL